MEVNFYNNLISKSKKFVITISGRGHKMIKRVFLLASAVYAVSADLLCNRSIATCQDCTVRTPFPSANCCLVEPTVRWEHNSVSCSQRGVTQETWVDPQCWFPMAPTPNDVVEFYTNASALTIHLNSTNITESGPADFSVRGIILRPMVTLTINFGIIQFTQIFSVEERSALVIKGMQSMQYQYLPQINYNQDPGQTALGLRSCKDLPSGFYSRLCGPGMLDVKGYVSLIGSFASIFSPTSISPFGKIVSTSSSFIWGRTTIQSSGVLSATTSYLHSSVMIFPRGSAELNNVWFDGWSFNKGQASEKMVLSSINNCGIVSISETIYTNFEYEDCVGVCYGSYNASIVSSDSAFVRIYGYNNWGIVGGNVTIEGKDISKESIVVENLKENTGVLVIDEITELSGFVNWGILVIKKPLYVTMGDIVNYGEIIIESKLTMKGSLINKLNATISDESGMLGSINEIVNNGKMHLRSGKTTMGITNTNDLTIEMFKPNLIINENGRLTVLQGASINHLVSRGVKAVVVVSETTLFINTYHCIECTTELLNNGTVYLIPGAPAPNGILKSMNSIKPTKGSPQMCVTDESNDNQVCGGCAYPISFDHGTCTTPQGAAGTFSYPDDTFCYACDLDAVDGSTTEVLKKIIKSGVKQLPQTKPVDNSTPRESTSLSVEDDSDIDIRSLHLSNARIISPDSTGKFITTTTTYIEGRVSTLNSKLYLIVEHNSPAILGGGELVVQNSLMSISIESYIGGGGKLLITEGSILDISSHSMVTVRNHSLTVTKTASLNVDGKLHFNEISNINFCGITKGNGLLHIKQTTQYSDRC